MGNSGRSAFGFINCLKDRKKKYKYQVSFHVGYLSQILPTESYAVIHIHKLSENVQSTEVKKSVDHNKLFRTGKAVAPRRRLQNSLSTQETGSLISGKRLTA